MKLYRQLAGPAGSRPSQSGTALAMAMVVVTVVAMMGGAYLQVSSALMKRQTAAVDQQRAFYLAEGGLAESFQAVRMGRTGQVGSETAPAGFGQGLVWVDAIELTDGSVRLDSTGLCGAGRSRLSLVVEPIDLQLGFFADESLVLDSVVLVDGWDSGEVTYAEEVGGNWPSAEEVHAYVQRLATFVGNGTISKIVTEDDIDPTESQSGNLGRLTIAQLEEVAHWQPALRLAYPRGYNKSEPDESYPGGQPMSSAPWDHGASDTSGSSSVLGVTTGSGAKLGSNGSVQFVIPEGETAEVWGDVLPGPLGTVSGLDNVTVTGSVAPRGTTVDLPTVVLPNIARQAPVRHDGLLPMLISSGASGFERIEIAAGAELVIRGPAEVLITSLVLEASAILTLDTRAGEVALFITDTMDLQSGSIVETSGVRPDEASVQFSSTSNDPLNPTANLDATSQFYGTVYAPETNVRIGSDFEVYGGVVARRLDVSAGARLHFDNSGSTGSALPRIIGWRVVEVPPAIRALRGDPIVALGLDPSNLSTLSEAHDLASVTMDLTYIDSIGAERTYSGSESLFNWDEVETVVKVERNATREKEAAEPAPTEPEVVAEPDSGIRTDVASALAALSGTALNTALIPLTPLSTEESNSLILSDKLASTRLKNILLASSPLSDVPLMALLQYDRLTSGQTSDVMLAASPLSSEVLDAVTANAAGVLTSHEITVILDANR